jgi:uncharacterized protein YceH (UPF0502 family)
LKIELTELEARVIGALIEKSIATPDQYPLSLNALTNACNQKNNRDPVMSLDERTVQGVLDSLAVRALVVDRSGRGDRVRKYRHLFCNTEFGSLKFSPPELAIVCELLLRGAQTPGELRSRAGRLCRFSDVGEVEACLETLARREDGPFVTQLERQPGRRDARYAQLFSSDAPAAREELPQAREPAPPPDAPTGRLGRLEQEVGRLALEVAELKRKLDG